MNRQTLNQLASICGWCFLLWVGFQILIAGLYLGLHDWGYSLHSQIFPLTEEQFDLYAYGMLGLMKTLGLMFFIVPWAALKIVARSAPN